MPILSQDIVDFLNQGGESESAVWLRDNPIVGNFVTCPCISVRPTTMPAARRIAVYESIGARFVDIQYHDGSHHYVFNVSSERVTVEMIEQLIQSVETAGGHCHVERAFIVMQVPATYCISFAALAKGEITLQREIHEEIDLQMQDAEEPVSS